MSLETIYACLACFMFIGGFGVGFLRGSMMRRDAEVPVREARLKQIELFSEDARHKYFVTVLTSMHDLTSGLMFTPRSIEAVERLWREVEFRYRNWVKGESAKIWEKPPLFTSRSSN